MKASSAPPVRYETGQRIWIRDDGDELPNLYVVTEPLSPSPRGDQVVWGVEFEGHRWRSVNADGYLRDVETESPDPLRILGWRKVTKNRLPSGPTDYWHGRVSDGRHLTVTRKGDGWAFAVFDDGVLEAVHEQGPVGTVQQARKAAAGWALSHPSEETA